MQRRFITPLLAWLLVLAPATIVGCSSPEEAAQEAEVAFEEAAEDLEEAAEDVEEAADNMRADALTGEDFIGQGAALSGTRVTVEQCSLLAESSSDGHLACRVVNMDGSDLMDAGNLPVDIFFAEADLDADAQAWMAENCGSGFCIAQITGDLTMTEGTDYREMTNVDLATP